jgi:hypothetical protein
MRSLLGGAPVLPLIDEPDPDDKEALGVVVAEFPVALVSVLASGLLLLVPLAGVLPPLDDEGLVSTSLSLSESLVAVLLLPSPLEDVDDSGLLLLEGFEDDDDDELLPCCAACTIVIAPDPPAINEMISNNK